MKTKTTLRLIILNCDFEVCEAANERLILTSFLAKNGVKNVRVHEIWNNNFPSTSEIQQCDCIIITGSNAGVYEKKLWIVRLLDLICKISRYDMPTLGICFGSQAIAAALGGKVIKSNTIETGFVHLQFTKEAEKNPLFDGISPNILVCSWHGDVIVKLPPDAVLLAKSEFCIQAYCVKNFYGIQFHPEFSPKIARCVAQAEKKDTRIFEMKGEIYEKQQEFLLNFLRIAERNKSSN